MTIIDRIRHKMDTLNLDGFIITSAANRRYVTAFTGSAGAAIIGKDKARFITDFRYESQAGSQVKHCDVIIHDNNLIGEAAAQCESLGIKRLGFENEHLTHAMHQKFINKLKADFIPTSTFIEEFREIKNAVEIELITKAAQIADSAFNHIIHYIKPGLTEKEVANELETFMRNKGAASSAFDMIIASGYRASLPHGIASDKKIEAGEMVIMDFGALYKGYRSDITRTVFMGEPDKQFSNIYAIVLEALEECLAKIKPGLTLSEADQLARQVIKNHGYNRFFGHGLGHGIGLDIHEEPFLSAAGKGILEEGMVITIEPGIYLPDSGGVRIEEDILITAEGAVTLSESSRKLHVI